MAIERPERRLVASERCGEVVASLAHEINNPLDSLLNLLHLAESEASLSERGRQYMALAHDEISRISDMTHQAMKEFRCGSEFQVTNVPEILRSVVDFYGSRLESHGISVEGRYCEQGQFAAYPGLLRQMFSNVLLNAADSMPRGGTLYARISLAHEWAGQQRHGLRVTIADQGCGIPHQDLSRITEPFFTTKGASGTGLGLALVKDTIQKHRGALRVRSSTARGRSGSVFAIFLPAA